MNKLVAFAIAVLVFSSVAEAAPRKHWYKDPKWWIGEVVIVAALTADAHSTAYTRGPGIVETNPILGRDPSNRRIAVYSLSAVALQTTLHASAWHVIHHEPVKSSCSEWFDPISGKKLTRCSEYDQDNLFWRSLGYVGVPAATALTSGRAAAHNYQLQGAP